MWIVSCLEKKNKILLATDVSVSVNMSTYSVLFPEISRQRKSLLDNTRSLGILSMRRAAPNLKLDRCSTLSNFCTDALLTRYAGDKFERSQHAYRTQRAQIHIQVYALRERRDDPAPKTHTPATLYYLLLYYTNTHATLKYLDYGH